eukprot:10450862-Lingulodinium_polyedra.AAC.1
MVLRATFLLLKAVSPEPLDLYGEWIRSLREAYGRECWWLIAQADIHMRSAEFERLRRALQFRFDTGAPPAVDGVPRYDPDRPWDC